MRNTLPFLAILALLVFLAAAYHTPGSDPHTSTRRTHKDKDAQSPTSSTNVAPTNSLDAIKFAASKRSPDPIHVAVNLKSSRVASVQSHHSAYEATHSKRSPDPTQKSHDDIVKESAMAAAVKDMISRAQAAAHSSQGPNNPVNHARAAPDFTTIATPSGIQAESPEFGTGIGDTTFSIYPAEN